MSGKVKCCSVKKISTFVRKNYNTIEAVLFIAYCIFVVYFTLLSREPAHIQKVEFTLMWAYRKMLAGERRWWYYVAQNNANILFFVPFGFLFPGNFKKKSGKFLSRISWLIILSAGVLFSMFIELSQFITCRGLCELDDLICNGLGSLIGYRVFVAVKKHRDKKNKEPSA